MINTAPLLALRDKFASAVCNWILNHIASEDYRIKIGGLMGLGVKVIEGEYMTQEDWWEKFGEEIGGAKKAEGASTRTLGGSSTTRPRHPEP